MKNYFAFCPCSQDPFKTLSRHRRENARFFRGIDDFKKINLRVGCCFLHSDIVYPLGTCPENIMTAFSMAKSSLSVSFWGIDSLSKINPEFFLLLQVFLSVKCLSVLTFWARPLLLFLSSVQQLFCLLVKLLFGSRSFLEFNSEKIILLVKEEKAALFLVSLLSTQLCLLIWVIGRPLRQLTSEKLSFPTDDWLIRLITQFQKPANEKMDNS